MRQPHSGWRAAEQEKVLGEDLPDFAMIRFDRAAVDTRNAQSLQRNSLGIKHPEDVMVGNEQQIGRRPELILRIGEHSRVDVAMRAYERFFGDLFVETQR